MLAYKELKIVHPDLQFKKVSLVNPTGYFYLLIAVEVDRPLFSFFIKDSMKKKNLIKHCKKYCKTIENDVMDASVFKAKLIPPGRGKLIKQEIGKLHVAKFDVVILIEVKTLDVLKKLKKMASFKRLETTINNTSKFVYSIVASNVKCINPVNHKKQGVFLFNYFFANSLQQNLEVWEYTAGWFQQETGLDNSTVLLPEKSQKSEYAIINHCRWDKWINILPSLIFKKTFRSYVLDNFYENNVAAIPILYKLS